MFFENLLIIILKIGSVTFQNKANPKIKLSRNLYFLWSSAKFGNVVLLPLKFCVNQFALFALKFYKYFGPKIYVLVSDKVWETSNFSFFSR